MAQCKRPEPMQEKMTFHLIDIKHGSLHLDEQLGNSAGRFCC